MKPVTAYTQILWSEGALRQTDYCRRTHLPIACESTLISRVNEAARAEQRRRVSIPFVMEVCRQMQNEVAEQAAKCALELSHE